MQLQDFGQGNFGGGYTDTMMHPAVGVAVVASIVFMLLLPRKYAVVPFLLALFLLPVGQQLYVGGVHLYVPRIIIPFGLARLAVAKLRSKTPIFTAGFNDLDKIFLCWAVFRATAVTLYYWGNTSAFTNQVAFLWDEMGGYFVLRFLIRDTEDIARVAKTFAAIAGVIGVTMLNESLRDQNVFGYLGSLPLTPAIREGKIRAQGPFEHALLAGSFAATVLPFFLWLWYSKKTRILAAVGVVGCTVMVLSSSSSTPLLAYLAVIIGICFWPLRRYMRVIRWVLVITIIACHLSMKAPVWFLIAHVDLVAGNSGYHRALLIDTFIRHFGDWWLIGTNHASTWGYEMDDLCNQWVAEGETGGFVTLVCFIMLVSRAFGKIGRARKFASRNRQREWLLWFLGVAMFSHCVAYFGISYFDQTKFAWLALLCTISVVTAPALTSSLAPRPKRGQAQLDGHVGEVIPEIAVVAYRA
jgi:hypothetical protein